jgi:copper transport protein
VVVRQRGCAARRQRGIAGAVVLAVHLVAISVWVGTLVQLLRVARANRARTVRLRPAFAVYARLALALVLVVALSGTVGALLLVPTVRDLTGTGYGRALLAKLVLVAVVAVLAWSARRRLTRSPGTVEPVARLEAMTLAAVLAVSAVLISLPTPAPAVPRIPPARHRPGRAPGHPRRPGRRRDRCQREPARDKTAGTR